MRTFESLLSERESSISPRGCPVELTLRLIGGKWKILILWELMLESPLRNGELLRRMPGITNKMLVQQLRELEDDGLITRTTYPVVPPKVEYRLTELGQSFAPVMEAMQVWGESWKNCALRKREAIT
ncbi:MAG: helix-turn-helix transcriptional regulator [Spirochaetales bacterium]|nr:helix-turn-helix transcriptional regulator [Spirochaetales bacterium]